MHGGSGITTLDIYWNLGIWSICSSDHIMDHFETIKTLQNVIALLLPDAKGEAPIKWVFKQPDFLALVEKEICRLT